MSDHHIGIELLAPAGNMSVLSAALEAGADAVYFGLTVLNARRGADNFSQDDLAVAVDKAHAAGARAFLTINIDISPREVGQAARMLELARQAKVDAVLVEDPALLMFLPHYPELEFHFSTQAAVTNSAGVNAAKALGITRVVLAREMSLEEIRISSAIDGVQTEVFVHGALCLCVSGRCLFSSWGGGRSGNRGACTSPCRVKWSSSEAEAGYLLSMNDLCLVEKLSELIQAGVSCFKIEGRLKNADWVAKTVQLYIRSLKGEPIRAEDAACLGDYAGRQMSTGYISGAADNLLGENARPSIELENVVTPQANTVPATVTPHSRAGKNCSLTIDSSGQNLLCTLECDEQAESWILPKSMVRHEKRGLTLADVAEWLQGTSSKQYTLETIAVTEPDLLIPRKSANQIADRVSSILNRLSKPVKAKKKYIEIKLPDAVRALTEPSCRTSENKCHLGQRPNKVRIEARYAELFLQHTAVDALVVEDVEIDGLSYLKEAAGQTRLVVSLPTVFFEDELPRVTALADTCAMLEIPVEVNGWDSWQIARESGVSFEGGPGMAVLNPLAARSLAERGFSSVWFSPEADDNQLEDLSGRCDVSATLGIFGRPVLVYTRAPLLQKAKDGQELADSRGIHVRIQNTPSVTRLRTIEPYCLVHLDNKNIHARWLCADLTGSPTPQKEWDALLKRRKMGMPFNYERGLY